MDLVGLKPILRTTTSFSALTLLVGSFDPKNPIPDMTYNVFSGTLNPTQSVSQTACCDIVCMNGSIVLHWLLLCVCLVSLSVAGWCYARQKNAWHSCCCMQWTGWPSWQPHPYPACRKYYSCKVRCISLDFMFIERTCCMDAHCLHELILIDLGITLAALYK